MLDAKEKIVTLLDFMSDNQAENILKYINRNYRLIPSKPTWEDIEEEAPDATDLQMLADAQNDPDCQVFLSNADAMKELGL